MFILPALAELMCHYDFVVCLICRKLQPVQRGHHPITLSVSQHSVTYPPPLLSLLSFLHPVSPFNCPFSIPLRCPVSLRVATIVLHWIFLPRRLLLLGCSVSLLDATADLCLCLCLCVSDCFKFPSPIINQIMMPGGYGFVVSRIKK